MTTTDELLDVHAIPARNEERRWTDPDAMALWVPFTGPTAWCTCISIAHDLRGESVRTYSVTELADRFAVSASRMRGTLARLDRFHFVIDTGYVSVGRARLLYFHLSVPPLPPKQWGRLPASVRRAYPQLLPGARSGPLAHPAALAVPPGGTGAAARSLGGLGNEGEG